MEVVAERQSIRVVIVITCVLICAACASGLSGLKLNPSYTAYFDADDAQFRSHIAIQHLFAQTDNVVVVLDFADQDALTRISLGLLEKLRGEILLLDHVVGVRSVLDILPSRDELTSTDPELAFLFESDQVDDHADAVDRDELSRDPRGRGLLVSHDSRALLIDITYDLPGDNDAKSLLRLMEALEHTVTTTVEQSDQPPSIFFSGTLALNAAYISVVRHDMRFFAPALFVIMILILSWCLRSVAVAGALFAMALCAVVAAFGIAGWLGFEVAAISAFAPIIIATLVIASAVHVATVTAHQAHAGADICTALRQSVAENLLPLSLTNLTTGLGFLALTLSPSPPIRSMGIIVAIGTVCGWILCLFVLPSLLGLVSNKALSAQPRVLQPSALARAGIAKPIHVLIPFLAIIACCLALIGDNEINDNAFEYFPVDHEFRQATSILTSRFSGINKLTYAFGSGQAHSVFDLALLRRMRDFQAWAVTQPEVRRTLSLLDVPKVKQRIGQLDDQALIARYANLAHGHSVAALGASDLIAQSYDRLAVHVYLNDLDAVGIRAFNERAEKEISAGQKEALIDVGGASLVFAILGQRNATSMFVSLSAALIVISLVCALALRSRRAAWIGLVCNTSPLILVYAGWALANGRISIGAAVVVGMVVGIIVDDTVHLLTKYARLARLDEPNPIERSIRAVGPAITITTLCICAGLSTGWFSDFAPIVAMSLLSVAIVACALLVDLIVLPALLSISENRNTKQGTP